MATSEAVEGLNLANKTIPLEPCSGCAFGKHKRAPFPTGRTRGTYTGELIHSDLCGPMEVATPNGSLYFALFIDDFSGWRFISFLKAKSEAADRFKELIHTVRGETGNLVRIFRTDNGGEWTSNEFATWLAHKGIRHETSVPHTPQQDGVSERGTRTVTEGVRSCLHDAQTLSETWGTTVTNRMLDLIDESGLPKCLWGEAASFTVYTLNRVLSKVSPITPYEAWHNKKPNISHLRVFGSIAYIHIPKVERRKLDSKSIRCIFVGYSQTQKAYRFWCPTTRVVKISRDVTFDEHHHLVGIQDDPEGHERWDSRPASPTLAQEEIVTTTEDQIVATDQEHSITHIISAPNEHPPVEEQPANSIEQQPLLRRTLRGRVPKRDWPAWPAISLSTTDSNYIPLSYQDAMTCSASEKWKMAAQEEYPSLIENGTWSIVSCPEGRIPIKSRWTFDIKPGLHGEPQRFKARFVAKGYSQRPGIDFCETYASVVSHDTLRILLSIIAADNLEVTQIDIKTAFLYGHLEEEIFMEQPEGFITPGQENKVCRLHNCIYGLKQASHVWGDLFMDFIEQHSLRRVMPTHAFSSVYEEQRGRFWLSGWTMALSPAATRRPLMVS